MGSASVGIQLSLQNNGSTVYKPLDVIRGNVKLKVAKEISVEKVFVTFTGKARTEVKVRKRHYNGTNNTVRTEVKRETHILVQQEVTIFPPENIRNVSSGNKFTLTPGNYEHDFQFKIPLVNQCCGEAYHNDCLILPPTMDVEGAAHVSYGIEVTVKRASWFKANPKEHATPILTLFDPLDELLTYNKSIYFKKDLKFYSRIPKRIALTEKPSGAESYETPVKKTMGKQSSHFLKSLFGSEKRKPKYAQEFDVPFTFEVRKSNPFVTVGHGLPDLGLYLCSQYGPERYKGIDNQSSGLGQFMLKSLEITLTCMMKVSAKGYSKEHVRKYTLVSKDMIFEALDLANLSPSGSNSTNPYELAIPYDIYKGAIIPMGLIPSTGTCKIKIGYELSINATFREDPKSWSSKTANITHYVKVLPGIPSPQEYIAMKGIPPHTAYQALKGYHSEAFKLAPQGYITGENTVVDEKAALHNQYHNTQTVSGVSASDQLPEYQKEPASEGQLPEYT